MMSVRCLMCPWLLFPRGVKASQFTRLQRTSDNMEAMTRPFMFISSLGRARYLPPHANTHLNSATHTPDGPSTRLFWWNKQTAPKGAIKIEVNCPATDRKEMKVIPGRTSVSNNVLVLVSCVLMKTFTWSNEPQSLVYTTYHFYYSKWNSETNL